MKQKILFLVLIISATAIIASEFQKPDDWQQLGEPAVYSRDNLWEYINGAADLFLGYGFMELESYEFSAAGLSFTVDIYDMENPLNAFGIYRAERGENAELQPIGSESVITPPYQALYLKDKYYVKINIFDGELDVKSGKVILRQLDKHLDGTAIYPTIFEVLPKKNLVAGSYRYIKTSFAGLEELDNCAAANYEEDNLKYECFVIPFAKLKQAEDKLNALPDRWKTEQIEGIEIFYRKIPYKGYVGMLLHNSNLFGIIGLDDLSILKSKLLEVIR